MRWVYFALNRRGLSFWRIRLFLSARVRALFHSFVFNFQSFFLPVYTFLFAFFCKQSPVNKTQNILKVIFYSKGSSVSSLIFTNPSLSF